MSILKNMVKISKEVGRIIKSSKVQYIWEFDIDNKHIEIQFLRSKVTNRRRILYNKKLIRKDVCMNNFIYTYEFFEDGHTFKVIQTIDDTDLLIDDRTFDYSYNPEKTRKKYDEEKKPNISLIMSEDDKTETVDVSNIQSSREMNLIENESKGNFIKKE